MASDVWGSRSRGAVRRHRPMVVDSRAVAPAAQGLLAQALTVCMTSAGCWFLLRLVVSDVRWRGSPEDCCEIKCLGKYRACVLEDFSAHVECSKIVIYLTVNDLCSRRIVRGRGLVGQAERKG